MNPAVQRAMVLAASLGLGSSVPAQSVLYELHGEGAEPYYELAVGAPGDVDGDGTSDFLVGDSSVDLVSGPLWGPSGKATLRSGLTGAPILELHASAVAGTLFGTRVGAAGDVDADGTPDLLVSEPWRLNVFSGKDASVLMQLPGTSLGFAGGAGVGDVNVDGYADVALGSAQMHVKSGGDVFHVYVEGNGFAAVHSGWDGSELHRFDGDAYGDAFGGSFSSAGDADGDGVGDIAVACYQPYGFAGGYTRVFSGASGQLLLQLADPLAFGASALVSELGDVDGDAHADLLLGVKGIGAHFISGRTGAILHTVGSSGLFPGLGASVSRVADVDGDGIPDAIVGDHQPTSHGYAGSFVLGPGFVEIASGASGQVLATFEGDSDGAEFGRQVAGLDDANGDGVADLIVTIPKDYSGGSGTVQVLSTSLLPLHASGHEISLAAGGTEVLTLAAGAAHAGQIHWLVGSVSGISPGIPLGAVTLPLGFDAYTAYTVKHANSAILAGALGTLDATGTAHAQFTLPAGSDPVLAGLTAFHAYAVFDALTLQPTFVSQAVPMHLAP